MPAEGGRSAEAGFNDPHIDKLVAEGFSFRNNYIFGGNSGAVCMPSRAMLMSRKTWFHVDTALLKDVKLLP